MPGPSPYDRLLPDAAALRGMLAELRALHARADAARSPRTKGALMMAISMAEQDIARAERETPPARTPGEMMRRLGEG